MDIRQVLSDFSLKLKEDRKTQVLVGVVILFFLWGALGSSQKRAPRVQVEEEEIRVDTGATAESEQSRDIVNSLGVKVNEAMKLSQKESEKLQELAEQVNTDNQKTAEILRKIIEKITDIETAAANKNSNNDTPPIPQEGADIEVPEDQGLTSFGELDAAEVEIPKAPERKHLAVIGAADSVKVKLLAGVHAPTDGTPYPVVLELIDDVVGPDGTSLPLGNARLIAAAQGSITDQRALFRLHTLNINLPSGARKIVDVDGWIVGEDGLAGMEGILIDPIGRAIAGEIMAGTLEGVGQAISDGQVTTYGGTYGISKFVSGDTWKYALGQGVKEGGDKWSDIIEDRVNMLVPHVRVLSGRTATAVFSKSVTIDGLYEALDDEESAYTPLD